MSTTKDVEHYSELKPLVDALAEKPEVLATGHLDTQDAALRATKFLFDLAISTEAVSAKHIATLNFEPADSGPTTRSQAKAQKEQVEAPRSFEPVSTVLDPTPISQLFTFGMNADQIWEQLELRTRNLTKVLDEVVRLEEPNSDELSVPTLTGDGESDSEEDDDEYTEEDEEDEDFMDDEMDPDYLGEEGDSSLEGEGGENEEDPESENESSQGPGIFSESIMKIRPGADEMDDEDPELDLDRPRSQRSSETKPRHPTLDDDFFSIDEFNRETEEMESLHRSRGSLSEDDDEEEEEVDLFKSLDDATSTEIFEEADEENGGFPDLYANITYNDFFAPPRPAKKRTAENTSFQASKKAKNSHGVTFNEDVRVKTIEARKGGSSRQSAILAKLGLLGGSVELDEDEDEDDEEVDMEGLDSDEDVDMAFDEMSDEAEGMHDDDDDDEEEEEEEDEGEEEEEDDPTDQEERGTETIQRLKNDLFEEEDDDGSDPAARLSVHERRMAELSTQIAAFEAENVGEKDWQLMGEASSRSRPQNSLLEEDLEFEHNAAGGRGGAPEITEEKTKTLEDLIKGRVLEARYDDVVRKRPVDDKPFLPSKFFELSDQQSSRSLAQIYEDEYSASRSDGVALEDDRDGKLAKEHQEIEKVWTEICYKLDALSNAHFTPKEPKGTIETISNISTLTLESALPATISSSSLLAPQEVHTPLRESKLGSRSELTPEEKQREHRKKLQTRRKQRDKLAASVTNFGKKNPKNVKEAKSSALESLVKRGKGVTVVGKEGKPNGSKHHDHNGNQISNGVNAKRLKL